jgi:hypothetical protein
VLGVGSCFVVVDLKFGPIRLFEALFEETFSYNADPGGRMI